MEKKELKKGTNISSNIPIQIACSNSLGLDTIILKNNFSINPNPVNEILYFQNVTNQAIDKIIIFDISGKIVLEQKINATQINVQNLSQGTYLLQIFSEGKSSKLKFIKQ